MCWSGGGSSGAADAAAAASQAAANEARQREVARQGSITTGMSNINSAFSGFNDDFYNGRAKAYDDYANPQLEDQYAKARDQLTYALSRAGILDSSAAATKVGDLRKAYDINKQSIVDTGMGYANDARSKVETNRSDLVSQLNATADPDTVAQSAAQRVTGIQATPTFSPLMNLFQNASALWATGQNYANNGQGVAPGQRLGTMLFGQGGGNGSQTIVR